MIMWRVTIIPAIPAGAGERLAPIIKRVFSYKEVQDLRDFFSGAEIHVQTVIGLDGVENESSYENITPPPVSFWDAVAVADLVLEGRARQRRRAWPGGI